MIIFIIVVLIFISKSILQAKKNMKLKLCCLSICIVFAFCLAAVADNYTVVVADIPAKNSFIDLMTAIAQETGNSFNIHVYPNARTINMVETNLADIGVPAQETPYVENRKKLNFDYSTVSIFTIVYVLYTKKNKYISRGELLDGNREKHKIGRYLSPVDTFNFETFPSRNPDFSFQQLESGRIDGCIYAQTTGDITVRKLGLKNIKRQFYYSYNSKFALQKEKTGTKIDNMLTDGIKKLKATGRFYKIFGDTLSAGEHYIDWQP